MGLPTKAEAQQLLESHVHDAYQRHHALMVATAMAGYAAHFGEDSNLWYLTGLLHDIDFEEFPSVHPARSLQWFQEWGYPQELVHAVEAHAYGYNGFTTLPQTKIAGALMACDEMSGIFYAYQKMNPIPFAQMKASSLKKRFNEPKFAAKIERPTIVRGIEVLEVTLEEHIDNMIRYLSEIK